MKHFVVAGALALSFSLIAVSSHAEENAGESGKAIYKRANCVGCHKWHGGGGGGYGGSALSLRKTSLTKEQIERTVQCGRPGTGMPYFGSDSYPTNPSERGACGLSRNALGKTPLAQGGVFLKPDEIDAVADYVVHNIKGKGDPNLADCTAFFGGQSSACDVYKTGFHHQMPTPTTTQ